MFLENYHTPHFMTRRKVYDRTQKKTTKFQNLLDSPGHDESCYQEVLNCPHVHDDQCGYVEVFEGSPCQYDCQICAVDGEQKKEEPKEKEYPPCTSLEESSRFLDELLKTDHGLNEAVLEYGEDSQEVKALQAEDDAMWLHVDGCELCKEQLGEGGAYYEKFYKTATLEEQPVLTSGIRLKTVS